MSPLQTRMGRTGVFLGVLASLVTWTAAQPRGACTKAIGGGTVVDMCEGGSWTLGRVYISISSTTMGDNSRCNCTLRGKTPGQNTGTAFNFWEEGNSTEDCTTSHVTMVSWFSGPDGIGGESQNFTCGSHATIRSRSPSPTDVYLTQVRSNPATIFNYCLYVQPAVSAQNDLELLCQGGRDASTSISTSTSTPPSTTPSIAPSSSSTSSSPQTSPVPSTSSLTSPNPGSGVTTSSGSDATDDASATSLSGTPVAGASTSSPPFPVAAVAGGISGGVALIIIVIVIVVVIVVIYKRRARTSKPSEDKGPRVHSASSEDILIDNILYESSSAPANNQPPPPSQPGPTDGRNVNEIGGGPSVNYCVTGDLATVSTNNASAAAATAAAAPQPSSDEYAVVKKPGRRQKPSDSGNAAVTSPSANVTLPSGDVYTLVDKSRTPRRAPPSPPEASSLRAETDHTTC